MSSPAPVPPVWTTLDELCLPVAFVAGARIALCVMRPPF